MQQCKRYRKSPQIFHKHELVFSLNYNCIRFIQIFIVSQKFDQFIIILIKMNIQGAVDHKMV